MGDTRLLVEKALATPSSQALPDDLLAALRQSPLSVLCTSLREPLLGGEQCESALRILALSSIDRADVVPTEVDLVLSFVLGRLSDLSLRAVSIQSAGLICESLGSSTPPYSHRPTASAVLAAFAEKVSVSELPVKLRTPVFSVLHFLCSDAFLPSYGHEELTHLLDMMDGESNPELVWKSFVLHSKICNGTDPTAFASVASDFFESLSSYFPIMFSQPAGASGVTKQDLKRILSDTLAHPRYHELCVPFLLGKLSSPSSTVKTDSLRTILVCIQNYETPQVEALAPAIVHQVSSEFLKLARVSRESSNETLNQCLSLCCQILACVTVLVVRDADLHGSGSKTLTTFSPVCEGVIGVLAGPVDDDSAHVCSTYTTMLYHILSASTPCAAVLSRYLFSVASMRSEEDAATVHFFVTFSGILSALQVRLSDDGEQLLRPVIAEGGALLTRLALEAMRLLSAADTAEAAVMPAAEFLVSLCRLLDSHATIAASVGDNVLPESLLQALVSFSTRAGHHPYSEAVMRKTVALLADVSPPLALQTCEWSLTASQAASDPERTLQMYRSLAAISRYPAENTVAAIRRGLLDDTASGEESDTAGAAPHVPLDAKAAAVLDMLTAVDTRLAQVDRRLLISDIAHRGRALSLAHFRSLCVLFAGLAADECVAWLHHDDQTATQVNVVAAAAVVASRRGLACFAGPSGSEVSARLLDEFVSLLCGDASEPECVAGMNGVVGLMCNGCAPLVETHARQSRGSPGSAQLLCAVLWGRMLACSSEEQDPCRGELLVELLRKERGLSCLNFVPQLATIHAGSAVGVLPVCLDVLSHLSETGDDAEGLAPLLWEALGELVARATPDALGASQEALADALGSLSAVHMPQPAAVGALIGRVCGRGAVPPSLALAIVRNDYAVSSVFASVGRGSLPERLAVLTTLTTLAVSLLRATDGDAEASVLMAGDDDALLKKRKTAVLTAVEPSLADHKRKVRQAAARCKYVWRSLQTHDE